MKRVFTCLAILGALNSADVVTVDPAGVTTIGGATPTTTPLAGEVKIGGGDLQIGRVSQASGSQVVRGDDLRLTPAFFSMIRDPSVISITGAGSALANRMHSVSGTASDYLITLPSVSAGSVVGFYVEQFSSANRQYTLDAGSGVTICGRTQYLTLLHANSVLLLFNGQGWLPLALSLDTPWIDEGGYAIGPGGITATTTNPSLGTQALNKRLWRRSGQDLIFRWNYRQSTGGSVGSGSYLFALPRGFVMDIGKIGEVDTAVARGQLGLAEIYNEPNGNTGIGYASAYSSTQVWLRVSQSASSAAGIVSSGYFTFGNANINFGFTIQVPIVNW